MKFESPLAAFLYLESERSDEVYLRQPINGTIVEHTFRQVGEEARKAASYLRSLNLPEKSHVGLISKSKKCYKFYCLNGEIVTQRKNGD